MGLITGLFRRFFLLTDGPVNTQGEWGGGGRGLYPNFRRYCFVEAKCLTILSR